MDKYTKENAEKLAHLIIEEWHPDTVYNYAVKNLKEEYLQNKKLFNADLGCINE